MDVRELIFQTRSTGAIHEQEVRQSPEEIAALYRVDPDLAQPAPSVIAIVDDILTTGAHFRAAKALLSSLFPGTDIIGLFIARRAPETVDPEDFDVIEP